ncbi:hypothetical protein dsat_0850 [Alkalidesulfovibrio alkalitolerans DSM 16529]|jgi:hypothetical protein|uniref:Uncharacterized protein n=1 Tax=Alkalidesulfovibrio alkalitolerans DSM 16529 TaxID=1121439 RepID=S7T4I7_9BACT|nr:hypothetical protein [Alkalidesulfovibrio alkalitolerans]EPR31526.1 hypothetical protein dsat_0850 [Alkalidesulfovibrio alkalitolerans DSM 16529]
MNDLLPAMLVSAYIVALKNLVEQFRCGQAEHMDRLTAWCLANQDGRGRKP